MPNLSSIAERRQANRHRAAGPAVLASDGKRVPVVLHNVSTSGVLFSCPKSLALGAEILLNVSGLGNRTLCVTRQDGDQYGARFVQLLTGCDVADALAADTFVSDAF